MLEKLFHLQKHKTTPRTELLAGLTTFLTMAYVLAANPHILSAAGMEKESVFVATCLAAALGSFIMAFVANWPIGLAPCMGLNVYFAYTITPEMGSWQAALGVVFISGITFFLLSATGIRKWLIDGVPQSLRGALAAGIGMFLAMVAFDSSKLVVANEGTIISLGNLVSASSVLTLGGFLLIVTLDVLKIRGAVLIGILTITLLSFLLGINTFQGIVSFPPSMTPTFLQLEPFAFLKKSFFHIFLALILVEMFEATGTLIGVGKRAGLLENESQNTLDKALFADSAAIIGGALIGTSSTTAYGESAAGVSAGGRTGMTALTVAVLFLFALFFSPIVLSIPPYATAPALIFVACLMMREFEGIHWDNLTDAAPAALTALIMPLTYSIANGIAFGFISYVTLKALTGDWKMIHPATWIIALLFILRFIM